MPHMDVTSAEAQRRGEQEGDIVKKAKEFLASLLRWSFALLGVRELLINMQPTFVVISVALIALFGISSRTTRSDCGIASVNFAFLMLGCLVVGIAIDSIVLNSCTKWVIYGMFLAAVATSPDYQQNFQETKQMFKSMCGATFSSLKNLFIQSRAIIEDFFDFSVGNREESSVNSNPATRPVGDDGSGVGEDIV